MPEHVMEYETLRRSRHFQPKARLHYAGCSCGWYTIRWTVSDCHWRAADHLEQHGGAPYGKLRAL